MTNIFLKKILSFRLVLITLIMVILISSFMTLITWKNQDLLFILSTHRENPWGIFSSLFSNATVNSLVSNMGALTFLLFSYIFTNFYLTKEKRSINSKILVIMIFVAAIIANCFWLISFPDADATGSSGLVYADLRVVVSFTIFNLKETMKLVKERNKLGILGLFFSLINFGLLFPMSFEILNSSTYIQNFVNTLVHFLSFLFAFLAVIFARFFIKDQKI